MASFLLLLLGIISMDLHAQRILAFDKRGIVKRIRYYEGDFIKLKLSSGEILTGDLRTLKASSFVINGQIVHKDSVTKVYNTQKLYGFKLFGSILMTTGIAYFSVDSFNRLINKDSPIVAESSIKASGVLLGMGLVSSLIANKSYKISKRRPLKIIDLTI